MNRLSQISSIAALTLILVGCQVSPDADNQANGMNAAQADEALDNALNANDSGTTSVQPKFLGTLVPPAPGEQGGLPDDRTPLNEAAARVPTSVEASGATIQLWGLALAQGRFGDAYRLYAESGRGSGMTEAQFSSAYNRYSDVQVLVGRPQSTGNQRVKVPVQMYGRMREDGRPFNMIGTMTLVRNPGGQKGESGQMAWLIAESDLSPRGTVKIIPPGGETGAGAIPQAFRGNWSSSAAACGKPGDNMRLAVGADDLTFYESVGKVTQARPLSPNRLSVTATYSGEGESWTDTAALTLSGGGDVLTIGSVKRVRCPS
ncbi:MULTISPECIES: hypothetical protein [Sphingobium]|uniref:hypothetical protein n=1 Tax=Sphingobium TaxID=165695 RepID=UPI0015EB7F57|nr:MULTISPECIES: hypothetical protein [Sphingobium]MCW2364106.1 hypothetical protein [Sphingobium sp. B10D3B]MCW2402497.1 hypothetical protein [Sphingobium sp. B10D7B]MCW2409476.1 hypothetical protein [Sphingobium xanthum]